MVNVTTGKGMGWSMNRQLVVRGYQRNSRMEVKRLDGGPQKELWVLVEISCSVLFTTTT
jgi:hypothetical protein